MSKLETVADKSVALGSLAGMRGVQYLTDARGRRTAVLIDLRRHKALWEDFWDGLVSESRLEEKSVPYRAYRAARSRSKAKRG